MALIDFTDRGLYCAAGQFYIDPWRPVDRAIITHAHSDHARWGSQSYLAHKYTVPLLELRMGPQRYQGIEWGETISINGVNITLFPAGHMIGSSQVRVEYKGETWVVSGDYKTEDDGISSAFEPVKCNVFISESTFGLPIYKWKPQQQIFSSIQEWVLKNQDAGKTSILLAYSLGKAQRILPCLESVSERILAHGAIYNSQQVLQASGWKLPSVERVSIDTPKEHLKGAVVIAPPSADGSPWVRRFGPYSIGVCSGWMQVRGNMRRRNAEAGFALSDHADWPGLLEAVKATGAEKVYVTHGFQAAFSRYLNEIGIEAGEVKTEFGDDDEGATVADEEEKTDNNE